MACVRVTVAIITRDEEDRIGAAVASAAWADEVLVLDSGSSDGTVEVARRAGARAVVEGWRGYGAQKNRAAELVSTDWVFSLDADELIGDGLARAVRSLPESPPQAAFLVRRRNRFCGRVIRRWPWSWNVTTRLYDRRRARFTDDAVHERIATEGRVGLLRGLLEHDAYRDREEFRSRQELYARLGCERLVAAGRVVRPGDLWVRPAVAFLRHFVGRGLLLNGGLGWYLSVEAARSTRSKYARLRDLT